MQSFTDLELHALDTGAATVYRGRVIPIVRGGSDLIPEPAAAPAAAEPAAAPAAAEPAAEPVAAPEPSLLETDSFRDAVAAEVEARWQGLLSSMPQQQAQQQQGADVDLNELLSPLSETFGENLARFLTERDQFLLGKFGEQLAPVLSREEQARDAQGQQRMEELITKQWNPQVDGELKPAAIAAIKDLAPTYLPEFAQRYGEGPVAAEAALAKASATIRALNADARGVGGQSNADQLAAVARAAGEPPTGGGAISVPPPAASPRDVFTRYFSLNGSARG